MVKDMKSSYHPLPLLKIEGSFSPRQTNLTSFPRRRESQTNTPPPFRHLPFKGEELNK